MVKRETVEELIAMAAAGRDREVIGALKRLPDDEVLDLVAIMYAGRGDGSFRQMRKHCDPRDGGSFSCHDHMVSQMVGKGRMTAKYWRTALDKHDRRQRT